MKCDVSVLGHWPSLLTLAWGFRFGGACLWLCDSSCGQGMGFLML